MILELTIESLPGWTPDAHRAEGVRSAIATLDRGLIGRGTRIAPSGTEGIAGAHELSSRPGIPVWILLQSLETQSMIPCRKRFTRLAFDTAAQTDADQYAPQHSHVSSWQVTHSGVNTSFVGGPLHV